MAYFPPKPKHLIPPNTKNIPLKHPIPPGTGNISADPEFEDSDFHLAEGSPCIDAGHPGSMYNDQDGTGNDMGAYGGLLGFSGLGDFSGSGFVFSAVHTFCMDRFFLCY